jgi:hypothetical protein
MSILLRFAVKSSAMSLSPGTPIGPYEILGPLGAAAKAR